MKVYFGLDSWKPVQGIVASNGTFDGVHRGHRFLLRKVMERAAQLGGHSLVITYNPHPRQVLDPENTSIRLLNTLDERLYLFQELGLDLAVVLPFTRQFSLTSPQDFIRKIVQRDLGVERLVIGYDHHFGHNRQGGMEMLESVREPGRFEVEQIPAVDLGKEHISSTEVRNALMQGDLQKARLMLGYPYMLGGQIIQGQGIGRQLGFPTANIQVAPGKLLPAYGVYAVEVRLGKSFGPYTHKGMLYIGKRPTVDGEEERVELNILQFDQDLYGKEVHMRLLHRSRADQKFSGLDALKKAIQQDERTIRAWFKDNE